MALTKMYFLLAAVVALVGLHLLKVGMPPFFAFVGMVMLAFSSFRKEAWLVGVHIAALAPTTLLMVGYQIYPNFEINPGRFSAPQSIENAYLLSNIVLLTSLVIFCFAEGIKQENKNSFTLKSASGTKDGIIYIFLICFIAISANFYFYQGSFLLSSYTGEKNSVLGINGFEAIYLTLFMFALVEITQFPSAAKMAIFVVTLLAILTNTFLNGARADVLGTLVATTIAFIIAHNASAWSGWPIVKRSLKVALPGTLMLALIVGLVRSETSQGGLTLDYLNTIYGSNDVFDYLILIFGTWADAAFVGQLILHLADTNQINWLLGSSYVDILGTTLPTSVYSERAEPLPAILQSAYPTGGGAFLPTVFYWNGAIWGVVVISALYGLVFRHVERRIHRPFFFGIYLMFFLALFRTIIYSEQALYKYILGYVTLFVLVSFSRRLLQRPSQL